MNKRFFIEENTFHAVVEPKLNRIVKKCKKNGNEFVYNVLGTTVKGVDRENRITEDEDSVKSYYTFVEIEVSGIAQVGNYNVVAMLEYNPNGNIIKPLSDNEEMPQRFWKSDCTCDHCKTNRTRAKMFVVRNNDTGEYNQVGGSCLKEFTGRLNAETVASMYDSLIVLEEENGYVSSGGFGKKCYDVCKVIEIAAVIINKLGYFSSNSRIPTKNLVKLVIDELQDNTKARILNKELNRLDYDMMFEEEDFKSVNNEYIESIIDYYKSLSADDLFTHNIQTLLETGFIKSKDVGYITYLPQGYAVYLGKEKERAKRIADDKTSKHFGEIGKRYKGEKVRSWSYVTSWYTDYGITRIYKLKLENGEVLTWKTSNCIEENSDIDKLDFTVKAHNEYQGIAQTEITRAKVYYS